MAALNHKFTRRNNLDFGINAFLVTISLLLGIIVLPAQDMMIFALLWHLLLGGYQLLSASVGAIRGNVQKAYYLCFAIGYPMLLFPLTEWLFSVADGNLKNAALALAFYLLPLLGAFYFTTLCYNAQKSSSAL